MDRDIGDRVVTSGRQTDRRFATTLARGLSVLRAFRPTDDGLANREIATRTGLPRSTVSRLTFTLQQLGYLSHAGRRDRYRFGPALLALGNVAATSISFVDPAGPIMQRLADVTRTLTVQAVRDGDRLLLIKTWRPFGIASIWLDVGSRLPLRGTSSGHCLLAAVDGAQFDALVGEVGNRLGLDPDVARRIRYDAFVQLAGRGFVIVDPAERAAPDYCAVAVPFFPRDLDQPVIFTCGAMPADLSAERIEAEVGPKLRAAVRHLERIMGIPAPTFGDYRHA